MAFVAVCKWWLALTVLGWLAWPLTRRIWPSSPTGGHALARTSGLMVLGYAYWLPGMLRLWPHRRSSLFAVTGALALLALVLWWRDRRLMGALLRRAWRPILGAEILFGLALLLMVGLRLYDPLISHTEQPMDFAFLNGILRSPTLPPRDPWLAGEAISYYYGGYWLVALLTWLTDVPAGVAYNLGLAHSAALGMTAAYGVLCELSSWREGVLKCRSALAAGLAALGLFWLSNLEGVLEGLYSLGWGGERFWRWLGIPGLLETLPSGRWLPDDTWWWWRASRVIYDHNWLGRFPTVITEFPAFSLILGDLHPHLMTLPFLLTGIALGISLARTPFSASHRGTWVPWALAPLFVGWLGFSNAWDLPTVGAWIVGLAALTIWHRRRSTVRALGEIALCALWVALFAILLYWPFYRGLQSQVQGIGTVHYAKTPLKHYLLVWGPWLLPLLSEMQRRWRGLPHKALLGLWLGLALLPWGATWALDGLGAVLWGIVAVGLAGPWLTLGLAGLMAILLLDLYRLLRAERLDGDQLFWDGLCLLGLGLTWVSEFFYLRDSFDARMNTVFKSSYQAWMLLGLAACVALLRWWRQGGWSRALATLALAIMLLCGIYTPFASYSKTQAFSRAPELDGTAYLRTQSPDAHAAIVWLGEHGNDQDVIVEAPGREYAAWTSRFSAWTGIPTILGWPGHEIQWRGDDGEVRARMGALDAVYRDLSPQALERMRRYGATYLLVGACERERYGVDPATVPLDLVYANDTVAIFRLR